LAKKVNLMCNRFRNRKRFMTEFAFRDIKYSSFNLEDRNVLAEKPVRTCSRMRSGFT